MVRGVPLAHGQRLADLLPAGELAVIENSGPFVGEDAPVQLAELITDFHERRVGAQPAALAATDACPRRSARSAAVAMLSQFYRPKAPPSTRMTMPRPIRTIGNSTCSQRSSTSAIGLRVATKRAAATNTGTRARNTIE